MTNPKRVEVSIIIPAYNEEKTISDCLVSLLAQDYPQEKYEIIVVSDGSTDNTEGIVRKLAEEYSRISYFPKDNGGKGSAQNFGLRYAHGHLVLITDADTIVPPDWVKVMVTELSRADIVLGGCFLHMTDNATVLEKIQEAEYLLKLKYHGFRGVPRSGANLAFKKDVAEGLGGFREDMKSVTVDFVQRAIKRGYNVRFNADIVVQTRGILKFTELIKQKLRWREYPLSILRGKIKPSRSDIASVGYTHGLSFLLFVFTVLAMVLLDLRYFLVPFVLVLLVDIMLYINSLHRMWQGNPDREYITYFLLSLLINMLVRLILMPYLTYCLLKGDNATFKAERA